ncbi:MAG: nucleotide exchange factor GrpE [Pseudomonadota bacterium]
MASDQSKLDNDEELSVTEESAETEQSACENDEPDTNDDELPLEEQLEKAQDTIKEYFDQMMRLRADMENLRKRAERDVENAHKYALKNFVENLLPIIDSMEMGQTAAEAENATLESIREGSEMTMNMFVQVLQKSGLEQINPVGEKFDPEQHQAISMIEAEGAESNTVIEVMQKGFALNERLVRPAMVVVAK